MIKLSIKNKIYAAVAVWLVLCGSMFGYFFKIFDRTNTVLVASIQQQNKDLLQLEKEQDSYNKAKQDLAALARENIQPQDFFGRDVTLVNEIKTLETISGLAGVDLNLSGLSGTIKAAPKAKTLSDIAVIPYSMRVKGGFPNVVSFLEMMEHLNFITNVSSITVNGTDQTDIGVSLTAFFYLNKK